MKYQKHDEHCSDQFIVVFFIRSIFCNIMMRVCVQAAAEPRDKLRLGGVLSARRAVIMVCAATPLFK
jgi:hypothetical protein